nr:ATP-dependent DNA helicase PIF1-like [Tanacetum cinerariifolium]
MIPSCNMLMLTRQACFFIDGPRGTGKTFLYKALLANVRSHGLITLATTSSGAAANNMTGGRLLTHDLRFPLILLPTQCATSKNKVA